MMRNDHDYTYSRRRRYDTVLTVGTVLYILYGTLGRARERPSAGATKSYDYSAYPE